MAATPGQAPIDSQNRVHSSLITSGDQAQMADLFRGRGRELLFDSDFLEPS